ncbi:MAG: DUF1641 domain-containing protein [Deltaproteobacteria bacterium]|nr:MAG: DUF1641 domain-containing protein [Deltaproteobacteria bacterium]
MNNEQAIMEQLDHLGQEIAILTDSARSLQELRDDLSPRVNETVKVLIEELAEIEADVQFEDLVLLLKNLTRNVKNLTWSVDQLKNLIDFLRTVEPLLKSAVPQAIMYLDQLEQQGVFQVLSHMLRVLEKIADTYTPEDIEQIGSALVNLVGVAKKLTAPEALNLLDKVAEVPARVDLSQAKEVGPFGMLFALGNREVKQGMGVVLELTKALSLLKNGHGAEGSGA